MKDFPLISVVIPAYNPPKDKFELCIKSIIEQDYSSLEIIVVNDGSSLTSTADIMHATEEYTNVYVITQENGGEGAARNTGIEIAKGEYIIFVDADDALAPGWVSYAVSLAKTNDADIVCGKVTMCNEITTEMFIQKNSKYQYKCFGKDDLWRVQVDFLRDYSSLIIDMPLLDPGVCSKLIRRELINEIRFPLGIKLSSDQVFNQMMLYRSCTVCISNRVSYFYIMNANSVSHIYQPKSVDFMMKSMSLIKDNLIENDDVYQAFYYRVLIEITSAIQFAYYSNHNKLSFKEKVAGITYAGDHPLTKTAMKSIHIHSLNGSMWKLKAFLLRHRLYRTYAVMKGITDHL